MNDLLEINNDNKIKDLKIDNPREMQPLINKLESKKLDLLHTVQDEQGNIISQDDLNNISNLL